MKTTIKIIGSAFIFCALNVNSFATDTSDQIHNSIESNKQAFASALTKNGRNKHLRSNQDNTVIQLINTQNDEVVLNTVYPKGRNLEIIDRIEDDVISYANAGQ